ncbi:MAG: indolepyruvate oxidoreductase subunit beta [Oligoflexia bacterium]|nr:indolepyruvate oxidoreductase subunit beta [Oligoflexia bacterium]
MKFDIVFAGVGGQGAVSLANVIAASALTEGLFIKQSEVHGMSQRGGAVQATLRLSDSEVASPLVSRGGAELLISMEPLEALRYLSLLSPEARIVSAMAPFKNIPNYPELENVHARLRSLSGPRGPVAILIDAEKIAREAAGTARAANVVLVGAASRFLPIRAATLEQSIAKFFARKGEAVVENNLKALRAGREAAGQ